MKIYPKFSINIFFLSVVMPKIVAYSSTINPLKIKLPSKHTQKPLIPNTNSFQDSNEEIMPSRTSYKPLYPLESIFNFAAKLTSSSIDSKKAPALTTEISTTTPRTQSSSLFSKNQFQFSKSILKKDGASKDELNKLTMVHPVMPSPAKVTTSNFVVHLNPTALPSRDTIFKYNNIHPVTQSYKDLVKATTASLSMTSSINKEENAQDTKISSLKLLLNQFSSMTKGFPSDDFKKPLALASTTNQKDVNSNFKQSRKRRRKNKHRRSKAKILGCGNFVCLLQKYELLKTFRNGVQDGFFLETQKIKLPKKHKQCKSFKCWIKKFTITKNSDGFLLKLKSSEKAVNIKEDSKDSDDWSFHRPLDVTDIFQSSPTKSPEDQETRTEEISQHNL